MLIVAGVALVAENVDETQTLVALVKSNTEKWIQSEHSVTIYIQIPTLSLCSWVSLSYLSVAHNEHWLQYTSSHKPFRASTSVDFYVPFRKHP